MEIWRGRENDEGRKGRGCARERVHVCVCVCVCEREREREREVVWTTSLKDWDDSSTISQIKQFQQGAGGNVRGGDALNLGEDKTDSFNY